MVRIIGRCCGGGSEGFHHRYIGVVETWAKTQPFVGRTRPVPRTP